MERRHADPRRATVVDAVNFLADMHLQGHASASLNVYRSAIASVIPEVGAHPDVRNVLDGAARLRPAVPRYSDMWDPSIVLDHMDTWGETERLDATQLAHRTAMLLALALQARSSDLVRISRSETAVNQRGATIIIVGPKERVTGRKTCWIERLDQRWATRCPVRHLEAYLERTDGSRNREVDRLFVSTRAPYETLKADTMSHWLERSMRAAGVPDKFKAHSIRGAATSKARAQGFSEEAVSFGRWASIATMRAHYDRSGAREDQPSTAQEVRRGVTAAMLGATD